jgi:hypothetical protein
MAGRRWYDRDVYSSINKSVNMLIRMPDELIHLLTDGICQLIIIQFAKNKHDLKQIGAEQVKSLYKKHQKTRSYDHYPKFHDFMSSLSIMDETQRLRVGKGISKICKVTIYYFNLCHQYQHVPNIEDIKEFIALYINDGEDEVNLAILNLGKHLKHKHALVTERSGSLQLKDST